MSNCWDSFWAEASRSSRCFSAVATVASAAATYSSRHTVVDSLIRSASLWAFSTISRASVRADVRKLLVSASASALRAAMSFSHACCCSVHAARSFSCSTCCCLVTSSAAFRASARICSASSRLRWIIRFASAVASARNWSQVCSAPATRRAAREEASRMVERASSSASAIR